MYEYVRPSWEDRPRPASVDLDLKTFGACLPNRPTLGDGTDKGEIPKYETIVVNLTAYSKRYVTKYTAQFKRLKTELENI